MRVVYKGEWASVHPGMAWKFGDSIRIFPEAWSVDNVPVQDANHLMSLYHPGAIVEHGNETVFIPFTDDNCADYDKFMELLKSSDTDDESIYESIVKSFKITEYDENKYNYYVLDPVDNPKNQI